MAGWDMVGDGPGGAGGDMSWINDGFGCRRKRLKEHLSMAAGENKGRGRGRSRGRGRGDDDIPGAGRGLGHLMGNIRDDPGLDFQSDIDRDFHREPDVGRERPLPQFHREGPPDLYGPPEPYGIGRPDPYEYDKGPARDRFREPPPVWDRERDRERRGWHEKLPRDEEPESPPPVSMAWPTTNEFEERPRPPRKGRHARDEEYEEERRRSERDRERDRDRESYRDRDRSRDRDRGRGKLTRERERSPRERRRQRSPERERRKRDEKDEEPAGRKLEPWESWVPETEEEKMQDFYCKLCRVQTNGLKSLEGHCQGKMHRMRAELFPEDDPMREKEYRRHEERGRNGDYEMASGWEPEEDQEDWHEEECWEEELSLEERMKLYYCTLCEVQTTSDENYQMHLNGMRHKANEERKKRGEDVVKGSRNKGNRKKKKITTDGLDVVEISSIIEKCTEPLVGLENIVEYFRQEWQTESNFYCQMCETKFQQVNFIPHVTGYRHRYAYIKIKRPEMKDQCRVEPKAKETTISVDGEIVVEKTPKRNRTDVLETLRKVCNEILKQDGQQKMQKGADPDPPEMPLNRLKKNMRADSQVQLKVLDPEEFKKPVTVPAPIPLGGGVRRPAPKQQPPKERKEKEEEPKPAGPKPTIIGYQPPDVPPPGMTDVPSDLPPDAPPPTAMMMKPGARPLFPTGVNPAMPTGPPPGIPMMPTMGAPMIPMAGQFAARPMPLPVPPRPPLPRSEDLAPSIPALAPHKPKPKALVELEAEIEKEKKQELEKEMQKRARDPYLDRRLSDKSVSVTRLRDEDHTKLREEDPFLASYIERGRPPLGSPPSRERMKEYRTVMERDARLSPGRERRLSRGSERRRSPDRERRRSPGRDRGRRHRDSPSRDRGRSPRRDPLLDRPEMSQKLKDLYSREQSSSKSKHRADKVISHLSDEDLKRAYEQRFGEKNLVQEVSSIVKDILGDYKKHSEKPPQEPAKEESPPPVPGYYDPSVPTDMDMDMDIANSPEPSPQRHLVQPGGVQFGPVGTFAPQPGGPQPYRAAQPVGPPMGMAYGQMGPMQMVPMHPNVMYMQQGQPMYQPQLAGQPYTGPRGPYQGQAPGPAPQVPAPGPPGAAQVEDMTGGEFSF